jgi:hypothetical protein
MNVRSNAQSCDSVQNFCDAHCKHSKTSDKIWFFSNFDFTREQEYEQNYLHTFVDFCAKARATATSSQAQNFFHKLPSKRRALTGIDQKMSESVTSDSRRTIPSAINFSFPHVCGRISRRNFVFMRAKIPSALTATHQSSR